MWLHVWADWVVVKSAPIGYHHAKDRRFIERGIYEIQERHCVNCGVKQLRTIQAEIL